MSTLAETERRLNLLTFERRKLVSLLKSNRRKEDEAKQDYLSEQGWIRAGRGWLEPPPFTSRVNWGLWHAYNIQKEIEAGTWRATQNTTS